MNVYFERLLICLGSIFLGWALVAIGFQWALWAVRTGRVDLGQINTGSHRPSEPEANEGSVG